MYSCTVHGTDRRYAYSYMYSLLLYVVHVHVVHVVLHVRRGASQKIFTLKHKLILYHLTELQNQLVENVLVYFPI